MLKGQCCLITGGAQGLGKAIAEALLKENARVFLADINNEELVKTAGELKEKYGDDLVHFRKCDVTKDLEETFKVANTELGHLDIVVNNAGINDEYAIDLCININMTAMIKGTLLAVEYMSPDKGGDGGVIINMSSLAGLYDVPHVPLYCATKAGIISYTSSLAFFPDILAKKIRMNCLCPSGAKTNFKNSVRTLFTPEQDDELWKPFPIMTAEYVAGGFMEIIQKELNGACMKVTLEGGYEICRPKEVHDISKGYDKLHASSE